MRGRRHATSRSTVRRPSRQYAVQSEAQWLLQKRSPPQAKGLRSDVLTDRLPFYTVECFAQSSRSPAVGSSPVGRVAHTTK